MSAEDLFEESALRLVHGDLRGADAGRGRFRDFVKGVLFHLVADHHKRQRRRPRPLPSAYPEPAIEPPTLADLDRPCTNTRPAPVSAYRQTVPVWERPSCTKLRPALYSLARAPRPVPVPGQGDPPTPARHGNQGSRTRGGVST
jgi:hypothetical protein